MPDTFGNTGFEITQRMPLIGGGDLVLAFSEHRQQTTGLDAYLVGVQTGDSGEYSTYYPTERAALIGFARRYAEKLGMSVGPADSVVVRKAEAEMIGAQSNAVREAATSWGAAKDDPEMIDAAATLSDKALKLADMLERNGMRWARP